MPAFDNPDSPDSPDNADAPIFDQADLSSYPHDHPMYVSEEAQASLTEALRPILTDLDNKGTDFDNFFISPGSVVNFLREHGLYTPVGVAGSEGVVEITMDLAREISMTRIANSGHPS